MKGFQFELVAEAFGARVPVWRPRYQRHLEFVGGVVGKGVQVLLLYRGSEKRARKEVDRLRKWGYGKVTAKRQKSTAVSPS